MVDHYPTSAEQIRAADMEAYILEAKNFLAQHDYVVHKTKSWRQLIERCRVAEALQQAAEEYRESTQRWAETDLHNQIRDLSARCTWLYGELRAEGRSAESLTIPVERTTGIKSWREREQADVAKLKLVDP